MSMDRFYRYNRGFLPFAKVPQPTQFREIAKCFVRKDHPCGKYLGASKSCFVAFPLVTALNEAVSNDSIEDGITAVQDALSKLPVIYESIKQLSDPTSSEARHAHKYFKAALKDYTQGIKQGAQFFGSLYGGPGDRLSQGGIVRRAAAGRLAFEKTIFEEFVKSAQKSMEKTTAYFSNR